MNFCIISFCVLLLALLGLLLFETIVHNIHVDYNMITRSLRANLCTSLKDCKSKLRTGDILVIMSPVHYVDAACHCALVIRPTKHTLVVLDTRKAWHQECTPRYVSFEEFLSPYARQPYRLLVRQLRGPDGRPLDAERLIKATERCLTMRYDCMVAAQQINRWIRRLGGLVPLVPQPEIAGRTICSRSIVTVLITYGALDSCTDTERTFIGPIEWAIPPSLSRRKHPLLHHFLKGHHVASNLQVDMECKQKPSTYSELYIASQELQRIRSVRKLSIQA
jgi:hypothetical protein